MQWQVRLLQASWSYQLYTSSLATPTTCYHQSAMEKPWNDATLLRRSIDTAPGATQCSSQHMPIVVLGHTAQGGVEWIIETISGTLDICCHLSPPPVCWPGQGLPTMFGNCHKPFFLTSPSIDLLWLSYLLLYLFDASWLNLRIWIWVKKIVELEIFPWLSNIM